MLNVMCAAVRRVYSGLSVAFTNSRKVNEAGTVKAAINSYVLTFN